MAQSPPPPTSPEPSSRTSTRRSPQWKKAWQDHVAILKPRTGGFATPVDKTLGRAGLPFTKIVLEAMTSNRITSDQAARHLDLKFDPFGKLRDALRGHPGTGGGDE